MPAPAKQASAKPTSAAKAVATSKASAQKLTQAKVIKGNLASLKALRAFKPATGGAGKAEGEQAMHADVMSGAHDQAELEKALAQGWVPAEGVDAKEEKEEKEEVSKKEEAEHTEKEGRPLGAQQQKAASPKAGPSGGNLPKQTSSSNPNLPKTGSSDFKQLQKQPGGTGVHGKYTPSDLSKAEHVQSSRAVAAAAAKAATDRPQDAFVVLNQAQPKGVFFKEDDAGGAHPEDRDDPELAAAVEETIRILFGVRGILRVGPGRNEANEPVVVVVASPGFSDASMSKVPPKVSKFDTLLAVPFEVLPLRKER